MTFVLLGILIGKIKRFFKLRRDEKMVKAEELQ